MPGLMERLAESPRLLADGAWGTELIRRGLDLETDGADCWNLDRPEIVAELARVYARHADLLTTNTFGANRLRLARFNRADRTHEINTRAVALAREAARGWSRIGPPPLVAGAMGPARGSDHTGLSDGVLFDVFAEQAAALAEACADFLLLETMTYPDEARIAVNAARTACPLEVVCCFAFRETSPGRYNTWAGHTVAEALEAALDAGAHLVGANCVPATEGLTTLLDIMRASTGDGPLWLKPNAAPPNDWTAQCVALLDKLGTGVIGGCCGTTPDDIARLRGNLNQRVNNPSLKPEA